MGFKVILQIHGQAAVAEVLFHFGDGVVSEVGDGGHEDGVGAALDDGVPRKMNGGGSAPVGADPRVCPDALTGQGDHEGGRPYAEYSGNKNRGEETTHKDESHPLALCEKEIYCIPNTNR